MLATSYDPNLHNGNEAVRLSERACQLTGYNEAVLIGTLAVAYAEAGRLNDAVAAGQKARAVALAHGQMEVAKNIEQWLEQHQSP
jgi:Flp pilus assembly protein TadD